MSFGPIPQNENLTTSEIIGFVLRNWRDELIALAREKFAFIHTRQRYQIFLRVKTDAIHFCRMHGPNVEDIARILHASKSEAEFAEELAYISGQLDRPKDIFIVLSAEHVLRPKADMPRTRHTALKRALRYEIERLSPVDSSQLYYDFVAVKHVSNANIVTVEFRIVHKHFLDRLLSSCRMASLAVAGIYFEDDTRAANWQVFPIDHNALLRTLAHRFGLAALGGITVFLLIAILLASYIRETSILNTLNDAVIDASTNAVRVERLQQNIAETASNLNWPARLKRQPIFVAILSELTKTLPDNTWITELTMDGTHIRIQGASSSASDLIGLIDHSPQFANAQFEAPLVHDSSANVDRFDLSFDVRRTK